MKPVIPLGRALLACILLNGPSLFASVDYDAGAEAVRKTIGDFVHADTTNPPGNEARVVELAAARLKAAGIAYEVVEFAPGRKDLVARLKGSGRKKPLLLLAHIDVVGTKDQKWSSDPHTLTEKDGFLVGRGAGDDLGMAAVELETLLTLKREGVPLTRDVILALTGDEESGGEGIRYLLAKRPELVDAGAALNEGGGLILGEDGRVRMLALQTAEKIYQDYALVTHGPTGHSSVPAADNAIYRLAKALDRLSHLAMPAHLLPVTRSYFKQMARLEAEPRKAALMRRLADAKGALPVDAMKALEKDPALSAALRTTCVATLLEGGSRENALPAEARANVNCRLMPDETVEEVRRRLASAIADPAVEVKLVGAMGSGGSSPTEGEVPDAARAVMAQLWPSAPVLPVLSRGATDSRALREKGVAAYGINPIAMTEPEERRFHGIDERIPVASLRPGLIFFDRLVRELAAEPAKSGAPGK